jgi:hypothetical protein
MASETDNHRNSPSSPATQTSVSADIPGPLCIAQLARLYHRLWAAELRRFEQPSYTSCIPTHSTLPCFASFIAATLAFWRHDSTATHAVRGRHGVRV